VLLPFDVDAEQPAVEISAATRMSATVHEPLKPAERLTLDER
jgi:hypothetical protein